MQFSLLAAGLIAWLVVVPAFVRWNHSQGRRARGGHFQGEDDVGDGGVFAHQVDLDDAMSRMKDARAEEPSGVDVSGNVGNKGTGRDDAPVKRRNERKQDKERIVSGNKLSTTTPFSLHFQIPNC